MVDEKWFGDDYLIINEAIFLSEITSYRLRSCLCGEAKSALLELSQYMERYYTTNSAYNKTSGATSTSLTATDLPYDSVPKDGGTAYYSVAVSSTASTYTLTLSPTGIMAGDSCGNYTINQTASHSPAAGSSCW